MTRSFRQFVDVYGGSGSTSPSAITHVAHVDTHSTALGTAPTLAITPAAKGDVVVLAVALGATSPGQTVSGITGGGVTTWTKAVGATNSPYTGDDTELWWGVVTATGAQTITVTLTGSTNGELSADEFSGPSGGVWAQVVAGDSANASSTTITWPSLTPGAAGQLYCGYGATSVGPATAGTTPGFVYLVTGDTNEVCYDLDGGTAAEQPTCTTGTAGPSNAVGLILSTSGGGAVSIGASTTGTSTAATVPVTLPTCSAGDQLLVWIVLSDPSLQPSATTPSGWTLADSLNKATVLEAYLFAKTALASDSGATLDIVTASSTFANWTAVDVVGTTGIAGVVSNPGYGSSQSWAAFSLSGSEKLTLLFESVAASSTVTWPSGFNQIQWTSNASFSAGAAYTTGNAAAITVGFSAFANILGMEGGV